MGRGIVRLGDSNSVGGAATGGVSSVRVNGRPVVVPGVSVTPHPCCGQKKCPPIHCFASTTGGVSSVRAGGLPVIVAGDSDNCGHSRSGCSSDVRAG